MKPNSFFIMMVLLSPLVCLAKDKEADAMQRPLPPKEIEPMELDPSVVYLRTYNSGAAFDPATHKGIYTDWTQLQQKYLKVLRSQVLNQDVWHQAESKAHFDNCDFSGSRKYIRELMAEVDDWAKRAAASENKNDSDAMDREITEAYKSIGKLLHGVQDFYSHTNYVEILVEKVRKKEITPGAFSTKTVVLWSEGSSNELEELQQSGLVSGVVWWGFPKLCSPGTPSHGELAKDSNKGRGAQQVPELGNQTLHKLALDLAAKASVQFIEFAWEEWPVLALGKSRDAFPLEVFVDRRTHE